MVEKERRVEDFVDKSDETVHQMVEKRARKKRQIRFLRAKPKVFMFSCILSIFLIVMIHLFSDASRIQNIYVHGNQVLKDETVLKIAEVSRKSIYPLTFASQVEGRLKENPLIEEAKVKLLKDRTMEIEIVENRPISYRYSTTPELILQDGTSIPLEQEYYSLIADLPLLVGFDGEELTKAFAKAFEDCDEKAISQMSEIRPYSESYDANMLQILMRDGNTFFADFYSLSIINNYNEITSQLLKRPACIFTESSSRTAFTKTCPWDIAEEEEELDEDGNPIEKEGEKDKDNEKKNDDKKDGKKEE